MNAIDDTAPSSLVAALPAQSGASFPVSWSGTDIGGGIATYSVNVSDNSGPFVLWQGNTTATSATYTGTIGHSYSFYSIARDLVGNEEAAPASADAATTLQGSNQGTVTLDAASLNHTFDGTPKQAIASTTPPGLAVSFTYNGFSTPPTNAGSYAVIASITDPS